MAPIWAIVFGVTVSVIMPIGSDPIYVRDRAAGGSPARTRIPASPSVYVAFDVLNVEGADVRGLPLKDRRAVLDRIAERYRVQKSDLFFGCGRSLFNAVCEFDLEGIIAKRLNDRYEPDRTKWWKILNVELFAKGRPAPSCSSGSTHRTVPLGHSRFT